VEFADGHSYDIGGVDTDHSNLTHLNIASILSLISSCTIDVQYFQLPSSHFEIHGARPYVMYKVNEYSFRWIKKKVG
jgi:hypothetical protein